MRKVLEKRDGLRRRHSGIFKRIGTKTGWYGHIDETILLAEIRDPNDAIIAGHLWFNYTKGFKALGELKEGDVVAFDARVKPYIKGYVNNRDGVDEREVDYKLSHPTRVKRVEANELSSVDRP